MKYVVILGSCGLETPIIFPETESHTDHVEDYHKILAAGFCQFNVDPNNTLRVSCWGQSYTLGAKSRETEDENLILRHNAFSN